MESPLFIMGAPRSGTTLLARMLDSHRDVAILPETGVFSITDFLGCPETITNRWQYIVVMNLLWRDLAPIEPLAAEVVAEIAAEKASHTGSVRALLEEIGKRYVLRRGKKLWGEKTPSHVLRLQNISRLFPDAKYMRIFRDPRDIVSSRLALNDGVAVTRDLIRFMPSLKYHLRSLLWDPFWTSHSDVNVQYEHLVANPSDVLKPVCDFIGISFQEQMLDFYKTDQAKRLAKDAKMHGNLINPTNTSRVGRFRSVLSDDQIALIEYFYQEEMKLMGYTFVTQRTLTAENRQYVQQVEKNYAPISKGYVARYHRIKGRVLILAYTLLGRYAASLRQQEIAITKQEWVQRSSLNEESLKNSGVAVQRN